MELKEILHQLDLFQRVLDSIYNGVVVTDANGYILHFNNPYGKYLGIEAKEQIGKHITDVIENTRMQIVAQTGMPEINQSQHIRGQDMVVQRIPIKKDGKVIAVFGQVMFKDVRDVPKLARKLSLLESKVKLYEKEIKMAGYKKNKSAVNICLDDNLVRNIKRLYGEQYRNIGEVANIIGCSHNTMQVVLGVLGYQHSEGEWLKERIAKTKVRIEEMKQKRQRV